MFGNNSAGEVDYGLSSGGRDGEHNGVGWVEIQNTGEAERFFHGVMLFDRVDTYRW